MKSKRFSYIELDAVSEAKMDQAELVLTQAVHYLDGNVAKGRCKTNAIEKIEEAHYWLTRAIEAEQIKRTTGVDEDAD